MEYREGFGFVDNEQDIAEMARLGIGMPPRREVPMEQQQVVQPMQVQQVQQAQSEPNVQVPQLNEVERQ